MKRLVSITLVALILMTMFSWTIAETSGQYYNETGFPIVNEPITVTVGLMTDGHTSIGMKGWDYLEEKTGIHFEVVYEAPDSDAWKTQLSIWMSSGNMPDLLLKVMMDRADANLYGEQGYFLDYMEYIDLMPNMAEFQKNHPDAAKLEVTNEGKLYGHSNNRTADRHCLLGVGLINQEWIDAVGMEMPTTIDELYDLLVAFRDQDPNGNGIQDEIPIGVNKGPGSRILWQLRAAFGIVSCDNDYCLQVDDEGKVYLAETTEAYKDYLKYMNKLYEEKLLDNNAFIMTNDEYSSNLSKRIYGISQSWAAQYNAVYGLDELAFWDTYTMFPGVTSEYNDTPLMVFYPYNNSQARVEINAKTEYPEAICRFIDYICYSQEGETLWRCGKEGVDYEWITDEFGVTMPSENDLTGSGNGIHPVGNIAGYVPDFKDTYLDSADEETLLNLVKTSPIYADLAKKELAVRNLNHQTGFPFLIYTAEEKEQMGNRKSDLVNYIEAQRVAFITGELDIDAEWDNFQQTMKTMGLEDLLILGQAAYDRLG